MKLKPIASHMTELHLNNGTIVLFSYETPVAAQRTIKQKVSLNNKDQLISVRQFLKTNQYYSKTTTKHINAWLADLKVSYTSVDQCVLDELVNEVQS